MKWLEDMNRGLEYVEMHLREKTDYEKIAKAACHSVYHFQRMFTFMTGLTLSEYIRRRKMTLAAFELQNSDIKVIDLALSYGYESPEAFTRAFQSLLGVTPTAARSKGVSIKAFPRITFQISVKGVNEMKYRIVEKPEFQVYGIEGVFDTKDGENLKDIPKFWLENIKKGESDKLARSAGYPSSVNAICQYEQLTGTTFPYMLCVVKTPLSDTTGYKVVDVPNATWAVFETELHKIEDTSKMIQELNRRVYTEWLPTADYEIVEGFEFEMYYTAPEGKYYEETWVRVVPKK